MAFKLKAGNSGNPIHKNFSSSFKHGGHTLGEGVPEDTPHYNKEGGAHTGGDFWFERQGDASGWTQKGGRVEYSESEVPHTPEGDAYYASLSDEEKKAADERYLARHSQFIPLEDAGGQTIEPITLRPGTLPSPERDFELKPSTSSIQEYTGKQEEEEKEGKTGYSVKYKAKQIGKGIKHGAKQIGTDVGKFIKNIGKGVGKWCDAYGCYEGEMPESTTETGDDAAFAMTIHTNRMDKLHEMQATGDSGSGFTKKYGKSTKGRGYTMKNCK